MLLSVMQKLRTDFDCEFVIQHTQHNPYHERIELGLKQKFWVAPKGIPLNVYLEKLVPQKIRNQFGWVTAKQIDLVLDCSGYAYSEKWIGNEGIKLARYYNHIRKHGGKVVLMPQAFGPFETQTSKKQMKALSSSVNRIYVRDERSLGHLSAIGVKSAKLMPDFTSWLSVERNAHYSDYVVFVPNRRMDMSDYQNYDKITEYICKATRRLGKKLLILFHEFDGDNDIDFSPYIEDLEIIRSRDANLVKSIIGGAFGVVASRYHAIVSALNMGVPVVGTSWSHKYEELFNEYGYQGIIKDNEQIENRVDKVFVVERENIVSKINSRNMANSEQLDVLYNEIKACLKK